MCLVLGGRVASTVGVPKTAVLQEEVIYICVSQCRVSARCPLSLNLCVRAVLGGGLNDDGGCQHRRGSVQTRVSAELIATGMLVSFG